MAETMKAYVLEGKEKAAWHDIPVPEIDDYDALVRVSAVAICTTDLHNIHTAAFPNCIGKALGHEAVGVVEKVGKNVRDFKSGDRVVIPVDWTDFYHPKAQRAGEAKFYQPYSPYWSPTGLNGHFAEFAKVRHCDLALARIPDSVSDIDAVMLPDMLGTGFSGVERMNIEWGDTVVVLGIGPVGLMGVVGCALRGASRIIAVGSRPKTKELAKYYGATHVVDYHDGDVFGQIMKATGGELADSVLVASGGTASEQYTLAMELCKWTGNVSNVSCWTGEDTYTLSHDLTCAGAWDKSFHTVLVESGRDRMERYLRLLEYKKVDVSKIATPIFHGGWSQLEKGLAAMDSKDPEVIKPVVVID